jgi:hypothetical protein
VRENAVAARRAAAGPRPHPIGVLLDRQEPALAEAIAMAFDLE